MQFLLYSIYNLGCTKNVIFSCERCEHPGIGAYFSFREGRQRIVICENNSIKGMKSNLIHELLHAYDFCRVVYHKFRINSNYLSMTNRLM